LNARIPDDPELFVRAVDHGVVQRCRRLGHVDLRCFKYLVSFIVRCGHFQDHPILGRSAVRNSMPGLAGDLCLNDNG